MVDMQPKFQPEDSNVEDSKKAILDNARKASNAENYNRVDVEASTDPFQLKDVEQLIRDSENRFSSLFELLPVCVCIHDLKMNIRNVNQEMSKIYGYSREEFQQMSIFDIDGVIDPEFSQQTLDKINFDVPTVFEYTHRLKNGEVFPVEIRSTRFNLGGETLVVSSSQKLNQPQHLNPRLTQSNPNLENYAGGLPPHKLNRVKNFIENNLHRRLISEELAQVAQLSRYHFIREFKKTMGLTPNKYVNQRRVERAKQLLAQVNMPIGEVSSICGFANQSHLNHQFKQHTGITPRTFREFSLSRNA